MKKSFKIAAIAVAAMTMVFGSTLVANAEEYFAKPRSASNCNIVNCQGHVSVYNPTSGLNQYYCVPNSWRGSADEYRTRAEKFFAVAAGENGVAAKADAIVSLPSKTNVGRANVTVAPVDVQSLVSYFGSHKPNTVCNQNNCKGHVFVKNSLGTDVCYCVPANWDASISEYQVKLQEYMDLKAAGITGKKEETKEETAPAAEGEEATAAEGEKEEASAETETDATETAEDDVIVAILKLLAGQGDENAKNLLSGKITVPAAK